MISLTPAGCDSFYFFICLFLTCLFLHCIASGLLSIASILNCVLPCPLVRPFIGLLHLETNSRASSEGVSDMHGGSAVTRSHIWMRVPRDRAPLVHRIMAGFHSEVRTVERGCMYLLRRFEMATPWEGGIHSGLTLCARGRHSGRKAKGNKLPLG